MTEAPKLLSLMIVLFLRGGRVAAALGVSLLCFTDGMANHAGGSVRHGSATIVQNGDQVTINQASARLRFLSSIIIALSCDTLRHFLPS